MRLMTFARLHDEKSFQGILWAIGKEVWTSLEPQHSLCSNRFWRWDSLLILHCVLRTAPYRPRKVRGKFLGSRWMPLYAVMHQGKSRWLLSWFSGHKTTLNPEEWSTCTIPRNSSNWGGCTCSVPLWTVTLPPEESACLNLCASETIFSKELYPPRVETKWIKWSEETCVKKTATSVLLKHW